MEKYCVWKTDIMRFEVRFVLNMDIGNCEMQMGFRNFKIQKMGNPNMVKDHSIFSIFNYC